MSEPELPTRWRQFGSIEIERLLLVAAGCALAVVLWRIASPLVGLVAVVVVAGLAWLHALVHRLEIYVERGDLRIGLWRIVPLAQIRVIQVPLSGATWDCTVVLLTGGRSVRVRRLRMELRTTAAGSGKWAVRGAVWISKWASVVQGTSPPVRLTGPTSTWGFPLLPGTEQQVGHVVWPEPTTDTEL